MSKNRMSIKDKERAAANTLENWSSLIVKSPIQVTTPMCLEDKERAEANTLEDKERAEANTLEDKERAEANTLENWSSLIVKSPIQVTTPIKLD